MAVKKEKKSRIVTLRGKKKTAIARIRIKKGDGSIKINGIPLGIFTPAHARRAMMEPITLAEDVLGNGFADVLDIDINVNGGGVMGQAYASRTALGKGLVEWSRSEDLKKLYTDYDRSLIIDDVRRTESKKCLRKGARARPTNSYR